VSDLLAAEAIRGYDAFFRMCVERPELATFTNAKKNLRISEPKKLWGSFDVEDSRYVWFVAYALKVFDDILELAPFYMTVDDIKCHLEYHKESINAIWDENWIDSYSPKLNEIVQSVIKADKDA
jgi:hypothetical protein